MARACVLSMLGSSSRTSSKIMCLLPQCPRTLACLRVHIAPVPRASHTSARRLLCEIRTRLESTPQDVLRQSPKQEVIESALPTEARLRQKQRLKDLKEKGLKPGKRKRVIEVGNDDCGDSLAGLGSDISFLGLDIEPRTDSIYTEREEDLLELFVQIPQCDSRWYCRGV